jgi:TfoX/Sxy family transcriptional regulator of competence genes
MAYDEQLAARVLAALGDREGVTERKMFGGLCLMLRGNMCVGVERDRLMVRVGPERYSEALARANASLMDFTGKPLKGFVYVSAAGVASDADLREWVQLGVDFAGSLPVKG